MSNDARTFIIIYLIGRVLYLVRSERFLFDITAI